MKERWLEEKKAQKVPEGSSLEISKDNHPKSANGHPEDRPQNPTDAAIGVKPSQPKASEGPGQATRGEREGNREDVFGSGMVEGADEAADAAVGFADAVIEQVPPALLLCAHCNKQANSTTEEHSNSGNLSEHDPPSKSMGTVLAKSSSNSFMVLSSVLQGNLKFPWVGTLC